MMSAECGRCDRCGTQMKDAGAIGCYCPDPNCKLPKEELIKLSGDLLKPKYTLSEARKIVVGEIMEHHEFDIVKNYSVDYSYNSSFATFDEVIAKLEEK